MATERINLFASDLSRLTSGEGLNSKRITSEVQKLRRWMQKHQNEIVPDSSKSKLFSLLQSYYSMCTTMEAIKEPTIDLIDDYLKLPEGKLVTSKGKQQCLRWLASLQSDITETCNMPTSDSTRYVVADVDDNRRLLLMPADPNSEDVLEDFEVADRDMLEAIVNAFGSGESSSTIIVSVRNVDNAVLNYSIQDDSV